MFTITVIITDLLIVKKNSYITWKNEETSTDKFLFNS